MLNFFFFNNTITKLSQSAFKFLRNVYSKQHKIIIKMKMFMNILYRKYFSDEAEVGQTRILSSVGDKNFVVLRVLSYFPFIGFFFLKCSRNFSRESIKGNTFNLASSALSSLSSSCTD